MYSNVYTNVPVDTWLTPWSQATLADIQIQGNDTKLYTNLDFAGIETVANPIDASGMDFFHIDVWSPNATTFRVKLVDLGGAPTEGEIAFNIAQGEWVSLEIPLDDFADPALVTNPNNLLTVRNSIQQLIISGLPVGAVTAYVDNVYFSQAGGGNEPPVPVGLVASDNIGGTPVGPGEVFLACGPNQVDGNIVYRLYYDLSSAGVTDPITEANEYVFGSTAGDGGGFGPFGFVISGLDPGVEYTFWLYQYDTLLDLFSNGAAVATQVSGAGGGGGNEPLTAAPDPIEDPADVISMFSDVYTDVPVDTWLTPWSAAVLEDVLIDGNPTKKYTNVDFLGIETTGANLIDASDMDFFHIDVWTPNMTTFRVKLVDFGADGQFGGGDDSEHEIIFENLPLNEWNSLQISFDGFVGLTNRENLAQLILSGLPVGAGTLFVDNVYYSKTPVTSNEECDDAIALSCGDVVTGTTSGASNSGGNTAGDVFYSYTGSGEVEFVTISLCDGGTTYDSLLRVYSDCTLTNQIAVNDDFCGLQSQLSFESDGVSTYIIMVEGFGSSEGDFSLEITCELAPVFECGGVFTDTGGPNGNYSNNEDVTWTITPDEADEFVTVIFTEFDVEANWDALYVFDGPDTSSPLISSGNPPTISGFPAGGYYGTAIPGPFASTHPSGALTFRFLSDGSVTRPGWIADIVCAPVPPPNDLIENAISVTAEAQPYTDPEVRLQFATNELLNPDGCAIAGTNGVWYSFTAEVDGSAEASVTTPAGTTAVIFYEAPSEAVGDETDLTFNYEWSNQCAPGTEAMITTTAGQSYYIFVLNTGGPSDVVIDISDSLLSTNDNTIDGFTFYPNPTMDVLNLRSNISIDSIELFNMLGQKVISQGIGATTSQVDVSGLASGTYLMKVIAEGQTATYQVVKR